MKRTKRSILSILGFFVVATMALTGVSQTEAASTVNCEMFASHLLAADNFRLSHPWVDEPEPFSVVPNTGTQSESARIYFDSFMGRGILFLVITDSCTANGSLWIGHKWVGDAQLTLYAPQTFSGFWCEEECDLQSAECETLIEFICGEDVLEKRGDIFFDKFSNKGHRCRELDSLWKISRASEMATRFDGYTGTTADNLRFIEGVYAFNFTAAFSVWETERGSVFLERTAPCELTGWANLHDRGIGRAFLTLDQETGVFSGGVCFRKECDFWTDTHGNRHIVADITIHMGKPSDAALLKQLSIADVS